jgi:D-xylose transport system substrate-binding protein
MPAAAPAAEAPAAEAAATEAPAEEAPAAEAAACTPGEGSIAVLLPTAPRRPVGRTYDRRYFEEAFGAAGVEFSIVNAEGDAANQQTQAEQALTNGAKVISPVNLDSGSGAAIIAKAKEAGDVPSTTTA